MLISSSSPLVPLNGIRQFTSSLSSLPCEEASIGPRRHRIAHADVFRVSFKVFKPKDTLLLVPWSTVTFALCIQPIFFWGAVGSRCSSVHLVSPRIYVFDFGLTENGPHCTRSETGNLLTV